MTTSRNNKIACNSSVSNFAQFFCILMLVTFASMAAAQGTKTVKKPGEPATAGKANSPQTDNTAAPQKDSDNASDPETAGWKKILQKEHEEVGEDEDADQPAARMEYFRQGRTVMGESAADLLKRGYLHKLDMIEQVNEARGQLARGLTGTQIPKHLVAAASFTNSWTSMGPGPIVSDARNPPVQSYGYVSGRVSAVTVDQHDTTGNTVYVGGAYGGVWKSTNAANATLGNVIWSQLLDGQVTEAIGAISVQPGGTGVVLVGTGEPNNSGDSYYGQGILRSPDNGATWVTISSSDSGAHPFRGGGFSKFAWSTTTANLVVGAFSNVGITNGANNLSGYTIGLFYSTDAGMTWQAATVTDSGNPITPGSTTDVIFNPKVGSGTFYAFIRFHGVYSSTDGIHWSRLADANQPGGATVLSATSCPAVTNSATCPAYRGTFSFRPDNGNMYMVWVSISNSNGDGHGIYTASVSGSALGTWSQLGEGGFVTPCSIVGSQAGGCGYYQPFYNIYITALPNAASSGASTDIYLAFGNIFKCTATSGDPLCTGTTDWANLTDIYGCFQIANVHPDQHAMDYSRITPSVMYFGNDGGIYRTLNGPGLTAKTGTCGTQQNPFDNLDQTIGSMSEFVSFSQDPTNPNIILGGLQDNGSPLLNPNITTPTTTVWQGVNLGDGGYNAIDPFNPNVYYTTNTGVSIQHCNIGLNCNVLEWDLGFPGDLVQGSTLSGDASSFYMPFILDPQNTQSITNLLVATCRLWRVTVHSPTVDPATTTPTALSVLFDAPGSTSACASSDTMIKAIGAGGPATANGSQVLYAGMSGGPSISGHVFVTTNADAPVIISKWTDVTGSINPAGYTVSSIFVDPADSTGHTAYLTIMGFGVSHVFKTTTAGASWTDITGNPQTTGLPDVPADSITKDPLTGYLYVGTDVGVFISTTDGTIWSSYGTGLPSAPALTVKTFINGSTRLLRAATYGRGVWSTALAGLPGGTPNLSQSVLTMKTLPNIPQTQFVTFTNASASSITINSVALSGTNVSNFSQTNTCGSALAGNNATCKISVVFNPAALNTSYSATLTVTYNTSSTLTVTLNGSGVDVPVVVSRHARQRFDGTVATFIAPGGSANFDLTAGPVSGGDGVSMNLPAATFECTGAPAGATCSVLPGSLQINDTAGAAQVTLKTTRPLRSERLNTNNVKVDGTPRGSYNLKVTMHIGGYSQTVILPVVVQ